MFEAASISNKKKKLHVYFHFYLRLVLVFVLILFIWSAMETKCLNNVTCFIVVMAQVKKNTTNELHWSKSRCSVVLL